MLPTVGRIVHYVRDTGDGPVCHAAIITGVGEYPPDVPPEHRGNVAVPCTLTAFLPATTVFDHDVMQSELGHEHGTWHWPERES